MTAMEASFMWLGGWRPSCALMLVYSLMGVQLQDEIRNFGLGIEKLVRSEAVLSEKQLVNLRNVQKRARDEEKKLSKKLATIQVWTEATIFALIALIFSWSDCQFH